MPPPPIRRPSATIRRDRFPPQTADATPAACRAPTCADSTCAPFRSFRSTSRPQRRPRPLLVGFGRSVAAGAGLLVLVAPLAHPLSAKPHPEGCLIVAPRRLAV